MKKDWEIKKLGEICEFQGGSQPPKEEWIKENKDGYIRMLQIRDFTQSRNFDIEYVKKTNKLRCCNVDDILLGRYGASVGKVLTGLEGAYNVAILKTIPSSIIWKPFIKYYFSSPLFQFPLLNLCDQRAAQAGFNREDIFDFPIPVPPLEEQKRIVKILDEKFAQLESLKANAQTNLQNAKDLFQSQLAKAFSNTTWEKKRLGDLCEIRPSKSETTKYLSDDDNVSFLPMEDLQIMNYYIEPKQSKKLKEVSGSYTCFANGDVLLAKVTPCFENGKQGIAKDLTNGVGFGSSEYIVFRPASELLSEYLYYSLATSDFRENGKKHLLGACGLKRLSKDYVNEYNIPLPPLPEQKRIVKELDTLSEKVRQLQEIYTKQISDCDELKQSLLAKAFEGNL